VRGVEGRFLVPFEERRGVEGAWDIVGFPKREE